MTTPKPPTQNTLKPCPFCGCTDINIEEGKTYRISCADCFGNIVSFVSKDDLINDWNTRATQSLPCAEVTREEYDLIWEKAYNDSRGSNVFNEIPSFKKCLTDAMIKRGLLTLLEKNMVGG